MKGNITKERIRKDLLWMHRSGIGGFQNLDAAILIGSRLSTSSEPS